jgi:hypothetical protein
MNVHGTAERELVAADAVYVGLPVDGGVVLTE